MAASLLHAAQPGWRPAPGPKPRLSGAYLDQVDWSGIDLAAADMGGANLYCAGLSGATLDEAKAGLANLCQAVLRGRRCARPTPTPPTCRGPISRRFTPRGAVPDREPRGGDPGRSLVEGGLVGVGQLDQRAAAGGRFDAGSI